MDLNSVDQVKVDQDRWVIQIEQGLQIHGEQEEIKEISVSVFGVPKELLAVKPEAYIPQCVSVGPYHHWRSQLYEMERYKVDVARRFLKRLTGECKLESMVEEVKKYDWQIRNCYHKYLDYKEEALAWLMTLDASFVLECLQFYVKQASSDMPSRVNQLGRVLLPPVMGANYNGIMRDLMMLENQLPLFLLQKLLEMQLGSLDKAEERLCYLVRLACEELSPFVLKWTDSSRIKESGHILAVLYYTIVPVVAMDHTLSKERDDEKVLLPDSTYVTRALKAFRKALSSLNIGPLQFLSALRRRLLKQKPVEFVTNLPTHSSTTFGNLLIQHKAEKGKEKGYSSVEIPPTRDELEIPSVSDLCSAGVKFLPTDGDLTTIRFDPTSATLYLPKLRLDSNTEIVLRNLVAFEASAAPGVTIFTRYVDFMNGIVDTGEDVRVLRESGIIYNHLTDDGKVASFWNSMGKCVELTRVKYLDQVIADVNKHYNMRWSVTVKRYINKYIFGSWQLLTVLASVILLLLTCLQTFCSLYDCKNRWNDTSFLHD